MTLHYCSALCCILTLFLTVYAITVNRQEFGFWTTEFRQTGRSFYVLNCFQICSENKKNGLWSILICLYSLYHIYSTKFSTLILAKPERTPFNLFAILTNLFRTHSNNVWKEYVSLSDFGLDLHPNWSCY